MEPREVREFQFPEDDVEALTAFVLQRSGGKQVRLTFTAVAPACRAWLEEAGAVMTRCAVCQDCDPLAGT